MISTQFLKLPALFAFLSPLTLFAAMGIGLRLRRRPGIDFGSADELLRLHAEHPSVIRLVLLSLVAPVLALGAGFGWYQLSKDAGPCSAYGAALWYLGMIFVIINDTLELALVERLPAAFASADDHARKTLLVVGATMGRAIELFGSIGGLVSFLGITVIALAMLQSATVPQWLAWLGLAASLIVLGSALGMATVRRADRRTFVAARLIGYDLFMGWIIATGVVMWRS